MHTRKVQSSHLCFSSGFLLCRRLFFLAFCLCFSLGLRESKGIRDNVSACVCLCVCVCVCVQTSTCVSKPYTKDGLSPERFPRRDRPCWTRASARIYACARARKDRTHDPNIYVPDMHDPTTRTVYTLEEGAYIHTHTHVRVRVCACALVHAYVIEHTYLPHYFTHGTYVCTSTTHTRTITCMHTYTWT